MSPLGEPERQCIPQPGPVVMIEVFDRRQAGRLKGAKVLLVDDVLTSGATSGACVSALKRAGAETVVIACFARVLDEALGN